MNDADQRSSVLIEKHLDLVRRSDSYRDLLRLVATALASTNESAAVLTHLADTIVRPILDDLSACSRGQAHLAILHLGVIPRSS